ncbi:MAG: glycosyltransferase family 2 protein [Armatimonadota bacterium]
MNSKIKLTISIVNWNTKDELENCLNSILNQKCNFEFDIIVVDNASTDGSVEMLLDCFSDKIKLIKNNQNLGFGKAHNQSINQSESEFILLLNPDCYLISEDVLQKIINYIDSDSGIGILGPKIINPNGSLQYSARRFPIMLAGIFRHTIFGKLFPNNRYVKEYLMTDWKHDEVREVDWLSGAAMLLRKDMLDKIGYLDERFFMYCEDIDICKRAHLFGWKVVYNPRVELEHRIGAASDKNPIAMIKQHHKSMLRYFLKYNSKSIKVLLTPFVIIALYLRQKSLINRVKTN